MTATPTLTSFWEEFVPRFPYVHPQDKRHLDKRLYISPKITWQSFPQRCESHKDDFIHLSLLPLPYIGNLSLADIYVLTRNPGFDPLDYAQEGNKKVRQTILNNLRQCIPQSDYPMWYLNPRFKHHPGYRYWSKHFKDLTEQKRKCLASRMVVVERFPYHSKSYFHRASYECLPSVKAAHRFVSKFVVEKCRRKKALVIVLRAEREWNLSMTKDRKDLDNLIIYNAQGQARAASLSDKSDGGKRIRNWLG